MTSERERTQKKLNETLKMSLSETSLIVRTVNMLEKASIQTIGDVLNTSVDDLLLIPNFGRKTLMQVYVALEKLGLKRQVPLDEVIRETQRRMPKEGIPLKEIIPSMPRKEAMSMPLINTKLPNEFCALLATGGILLIKDAVDCSEETLLFLLGQDSSELDARASLIMLKRVMADLGV